MVNWPEWADKPTRDASMEKMIKDERIQGLMSCEKSWRLRAPRSASDGDVELCRITGLSGISICGVRLFCSVANRGE
jgi:hypothetical protein